jgi:hypothetical protein
MDERFVCHMACLAVIALLLLYMAWRGGEE